MLSSSFTAYCQRISFKRDNVCIDIFQIKKINNLIKLNGEGKVEYKKFINAIIGHSGEFLYIV